MFRRKAAADLSAVLFYVKSDARRANSLVARLRDRGVSIAPCAVGTDMARRANVGNRSLPVMAIPNTANVRFSISRQKRPDCNRPKGKFASIVPTVESWC